MILLIFSTIYPEKNVHYPGVRQTDRLNLFSRNYDTENNLLFANTKNTTSIVFFFEENVLISLLCLRIKRNQRNSININENSNNYKRNTVKNNLDGDCEATG